MNEEAGYERQTLILDPDTGQLLAEVWETLRGGPTPPGTKTYAVFHTPALVDAVGELPR